MPVVASVRSNVTITSALADSQRATATVVIDNGDSVQATVNISDDARLAAAAPAAQIAVRLAVDLGSGLVTLPASEPPAELTIRESADEIGDTLRFQLAGPNWNPHVRAFGRGLSKVEAHIGYGEPGAVFFAKVFTGYVAEAPYSFSPPVLSVLAIDGSIKHRYKRLKDFAVDADSGRTRLSILQEMLSLAEIPARVDLGRNSGGTVNKPVTPGEAYILEYIRDWLSVLDVEIGFVDDVLVIQRFDPSGITVATMTPSNVERGGLSTTPPASLAANKVVAKAIRYERSLPDGESSETTVVETIMPYAQQSWVIQQQSGADSVNPNPQPSATMRVVSRITTKNTRRGTLVVRTEQTEEAIYSRIRSRLTFVTPAGTVSEVNGVYQYPDGTWRRDPTERLMPIRHNVVEKKLDDELRVVEVIERDYHYRFHARALYEVDGSGESAEDVVISQGNVPLLEDGQGVVESVEMIGGIDYLGSAPMVPDRYTKTTYELDEDGLIASEEVIERYPSKGVPRSAKTDGTFAYGLSEREYMSKPNELVQSIVAGVPLYHGLTITRRSYRDLSEDEFETVETTIENGNPVTVRTRGTGTRPAPERVEPETITQALEAAAVDEERVMLSYEIESFAHNEYIESRGEALAVADAELRRLSAISFAISMPLEGLIHKWKWVTLNLPLFGLNNMRLYVREVERNFGRFRQTVKADFYPTLSP